MERVELEDSGTDGGVVVERDAPTEKLPEATEVPSTAPLQPGSNDEVAQGALGDGRFRGASDDADIAGEPPAAPVSSRLPLPLFAGLAAVVVAAAVTVAVIASRARSRRRSRSR